MHSGKICMVCRIKDTVYQSSPINIRLLFPGCTTATEITESDLSLWVLWNEFERKYGVKYRIGRRKKMTYIKRNDNNCPWKR